MSFNAGTLPDMDACVDQVQDNINRGVLSESTRPKLSQVQSWLVRAKQELCEEHGFTWRWVYAYMDTGSGQYRYSLLPDFGGGGHIIRDITQDERLAYIDPVAYDTLFPDPANDTNIAPEYYTIKGDELWLSQPAGGTYRLELEYERTGDDTSTTDVTYLPELMRFRMCDYATYKGFIVLEMWEAASAYKAEWSGGKMKSKKRGTKDKWKQMGYKVRPYIV